MPLCVPVRRVALLNYFWTPLTEQLRFRNKINLKNPLPPHWDRARMMRLCEPQYAPVLKVCNVEEDRAKVKQRVEDNPYGVFLAKDMRYMFYKHPMVAIYHNNAFIAHDILKLRGIFFDGGFEMTFRSTQNKYIARLALTNTKYEPVLRLISGHSSIMFCQTTDVATLLKLNKKIPQFILIGLLLEDRLMHKDDFEAYAKLNIDTARGQFCNTLSLAGGASLSNSLVSNINALSHSLNTYSSTKDSPSKDSIEPETPPSKDVNEAETPVTPTGV